MSGRAQAVPAHAAAGTVYHEGPMTARVDSAGVSASLASFAEAPAWPARALPSTPAATGSASSPEFVRHFGCQVADNRRDPPSTKRSRSGGTKRTGHSTRLIHEPTRQKQSGGLTGLRQGGRCAERVFGGGAVGIRVRNTQFTRRRWPVSGTWRHLGAVRAAGPGEGSARRCGRAIRRVRAGSRVRGRACASAPTRLRWSS